MGAYEAMFFLTGNLSLVTYRSVEYKESGYSTELRRQNIVNLNNSLEENDRWKGDNNGLVK